MKGQTQTGADQRTDRLARLIARNICSVQAKISKPLNLWFGQRKFRQQCQILVLSLLVSCSLLALSLWLLPFGYQDLGSRKHSWGNIGKASVSPQGYRQEAVRSDTLITHQND